MKSFSIHEGVVAPLDRSNIDTDAILPKQFLKSIRRTGFGRYLFDAWRYLDVGVPDQDCTHRPLNPDFVLNQNRYVGASILLTRENFGCGSSREHAPWALADYGMRVIIAPSFADIFFNNCFKNGLLPVTLSTADVDRLFSAVHETPGFSLTVDLERQLIRWPDQATTTEFVVDPPRKQRLLHGLDDIAATLTQSEAIRAYETRRVAVEPWAIVQN